MKRAKGHLRIRHECPRCGRVIWGNAYYRHMLACQGAHMDGVQGITEVDWEK